MSYIRDLYGTGYTLAHFGDLHAYATVGDEIAFVANSADELGLEIALFSGDLGNAGASNWNAAEMATMRGYVDQITIIPKIIIPGNHDYTEVSTRDLADWNALFPQSYFSSQAGTWGFYEAGHSENLYCVVGGRLYIGLEYGPRQGALDWAKTVLTTNASLPAVILTHGFMYRDNTRCGAGDEYNPHLDINGDDIHDGDEMYAELKGYANIFLFLSGHDINGTNSTTLGTVAKRVDTGDSGNAINQIMANYQQLSPRVPMTRFLKIRSSPRTIEVNTFSGLNCLAGDTNKFSVTY